MESYKHKDIKYDLYWNQINEDIYATVEKTIGRTRTDVFTQTEKISLAIEIQYTPLPISTILHRMKEHTKENIYTLWLLTEELLMSKDRVKNLKCTRFLQQLQNGVIFLIKDQKIIPTRIDNALKYLPSKIVVDKKKVLDSQIPIELNDLCFTKNDCYGVNITTMDEWWLDSYAECLELS